MCSHFKLKCSLVVFYIMLINHARSASATNIARTPPLAVSDWRKVSQSLICSAVHLRGGIFVLCLQPGGVPPVFSLHDIYNQFMSFVQEKNVENKIKRSVFK